MQKKLYSIIYENGERKVIDRFEDGMETVYKFYKRYRVEIVDEQRAKEHVNEGGMLNGMNAYKNAIESEIKNFKENPYVYSANAQSRGLVSINSKIL